MPGTYDLNLYRGDSYAWRFRLWQDAEMTIPDDLTGATVSAEIRDKSAGLFVVALVCVITLPNIIDMTMTPAMYATCPRSGVWDIQLTYQGGRVHTILGGKTTVTLDVTDSKTMPAVQR